MSATTRGERVDGTARSPRIARLVSGALALGAAACALFAVQRFVANSAGLAPVLGASFRPLAVALALASVLALATTGNALRGRLDLAPALASAFVVVVAGWLVVLTWVQPPETLWLEFALGLASGAWALALFLWHAVAHRRRRAAVLGGRILVLLASVAVVAEVALRTLAHVKPSPLLVRVGDAERSVIERFRCKPGLVRFGFACNSRGFYDDELGAKRPGERRIVAVGDSFLLGSVPHAYHWTTRLEQALGVQVAAVGVPGIGPFEYARLTVDEALPLDPDVLVVSFFVGNDFELEDRSRTVAWWRELAARDRSLLFTVTTRVLRLREEVSAVEGPVASVQGERAAHSADGDLAKEFPWLEDPRLETPTLSAEAHLRLEVERARRACRVSPTTLESVERAFATIRDASAGRNLTVVLVPDEFQVDDPLWGAVLAATGEPSSALDRDRPQRELKRVFERLGVRCVDLLPALRALEPLDDGSRHLYHARDTHFNARGNAVTADVLARELLPLARR